MQSVEVSHVEAFEAEQVRRGRGRANSRMIAEGLWRAKSRRTVRVYQSRPRRECVGDLVQIDGSPHDWFERNLSTTLRH